MGAKEFFLDLLFPRACVACEKYVQQGAACEACMGKVRRFDTLYCGRCRARLPGTAKICHHDFPYLLAAAASYDDDLVKALVHALKFQYVRDAAAPLADLMSETAFRIPVDWSRYAIIPVPLSSKRLRERGFNQSELIGNAMGKALGIPVASGVLARSRHAPPQSSVKGHAERIDNVKNCFAAKGAPPPYVLLVDDVTTSGATLFEAARVLKAAGAKKIIAFVAALA